MSLSFDAASPLTREEDDGSQGVRADHASAIEPARPPAAPRVCLHLLDVTSQAQKALRQQGRTAAITCFAEELTRLPAGRWHLDIKVHARRRERFSLARGASATVFRAHVHWTLLEHDGLRLTRLLRRWAEGDTISDEDRLWARTLADPTTPVRVRPDDHADESGRLHAVKRRLMALAPTEADRVHLEEWQCAWLRAGRRRRRSGGIHLRLGLCDPATRTLLVSRRLDHPDVPDYVLDHVMWHEMSHVLRPPFVHNGRRHIHHAEFKQLEQSLPAHHDAEKWIREHIKWLSETRD
jgi:predicted metal-dependent hydrolase